MQIWIDADACPTVIKEILYKAAERTGISLTLVANQPLRIPSSPLIQSVRVGAGMNVADDEIVKRLEAGDLVITADIPLAAEVIAKGGLALNPRGELYTEDDIASRLSMRDFMESLRGSGVDTGGPAPLKATDRAAFAKKKKKILAKAT